MEVVLISIAGAVASFVAAFIKEAFSRHEQQAETLEDRISKLSSALGSSSKLVAEIESEISKRQSLVVELQRDADHYQTLISLNKEQVDAVAQVFQGELRREGSRSFWKGVIVNFVFFVVGAALSWYLSARA